MEYLTGSFVVGPFALSKPRLAACAFAIGITAASFVFLRSTRLGKAIRAVSQSREVAQVCGIDVQRIHLLAFGLGSALAAAGGSLVAVMVAIQPEMGQVYTFKSFLVIVLGGMTLLTHDPRFVLAKPAIGHVAIGLAVAERLARSPAAGRFRFLFQPAEEGGGGKILMARQGAFEGVDAADLKASRAAELAGQ